jgi:hypothetical protein
MPYGLLVSTQKPSPFSVDPLDAQLQLLIMSLFSAMEASIPQTRLYVGSRKCRITDTSMLNTWPSRVRPSLRRSNLGMRVWLRCSRLSISLRARPLFPFPFRRGGGGNSAQIQADEKSVNREM